MDFDSKSSVYEIGWNGKRVGSTPICFSYDFMGDEQIPFAGFFLAGVWG